MPDVGPRREQTADPSVREDDFALVMGALTEGALRFPAPFDLASSSALALNNGRGADAVRAFVERRQAITPHYRVAVFEEVSSGPEREIINCVVPDPRLVVALLVQLAQELHPDEGVL